jgi:tetratricopeptide (TPR) repeat protein
MRLQFGILAMVASAGLLGWSRHHTSITSHSAVPPSRPAADIREQDIAFYQNRVARDPFGARDLAMLGSLYLARARETGSYQDLLRAEDAARTSYSHRTRRNGAAAALLASTLLAEHRFTEAYTTAKALVEADSSEPGTRAMLGEIALELGHYEEARQLFSTIATLRYAPALAPRYARWLELEGRPVEALDLLRSVRKDLENGFRVPPEQLAWFDLRIGDLELRRGKLREAGKAYASGLAVAPDDYRLLGAEARLHAAKKDWGEAIRYGEQAIASVLDPATLGLLSDCYAAQGDTAKAAEYAKAMEVSVSQQPGAFHRAWSLFLLDHGRDVPLVLRKASEELHSRKDVYGYDLVAWALHQMGRDVEAAPLVDQALSQGTRDAMLYWHAGAVAAALGDSTLARARFAEARRINPYYQAQSRKP